MNLNIWTASNLSTDSCEHIKKLIESIKIASYNKCNITHYFGISHTDSELFKKINNYLNSEIQSNYNIIIYSSCTKQTQFENLYNIYLNTVLQPDDIIMFMDDDDLLLNIPSEIFCNSIIKGQQYIPNHEQVYITEKYDIHQVKTFVENNHLNSGIDFSGYTARYIFINDYFQNRNLDSKSREYVEMLEDCEFMTFLDNNDTDKLSLEAFIFRRIKVNGSAWVSDLKNKLKCLCDKLESSRDKLKCLDNASEY